MLLILLLFIWSNAPFLMSKYLFLLNPTPIPNKSILKVVPVWFNLDNLFILINNKLNRKQP